MIRANRLTREEKHEIAQVLKRFRLLPPVPCQIVLHCVDGTVQAVEYQGLKLK